MSVRTVSTPPDNAESYLNSKHSPAWLPRAMKTTEVTDIVIIDETEACPYLDGKTARMPLRMPLSRITQEQADQRLAEGNRRTGEYIYQTRCPNCQACEPIRIDVTQFAFSANQRRTLNKGNRKFRSDLSHLTCDPERIQLFNKHRRLRGLAKRDTDIDAEQYILGFVRSCFDSFEITYWQDSRLVCLAVCDRGANSLSAVYTFYDPDLKSDSLGTYSILKQIEYCQEMNLTYLYLGYYVAQSSHMQYKSRFKPNERLIDGQWVSFA